ncbi:MAG: hypothetical protein ACOC80_01920 [Petrotogales bacterium]
MKKIIATSIVIMIFLTLYGLDPFQTQTGGNCILATDYWATYGSPSDLYGIEYNGLSVQLYQGISDYATSTNPRNLHFYLYDSSSSGMAGILEYSMDIGSIRDHRIFSYTVSTDLSNLTKMGGKISVKKENETNYPEDTYWLTFNGGITGKGLSYLDYVIFVDNGLLWKSGSSSTKDFLDLMLGTRFMFDKFRFGLEIGTRNGMDVLYGGLSSEVDLMSSLQARAGVSVNTEPTWEVFDWIIGGGFDLKAGNMIFSVGAGANFSNNISEGKLNMKLMLSGMFTGLW